MCYSARWLLGTPFTTLLTDLLLALPSLSGLSAFFALLLFCCVGAAFSLRFVSFFCFVVLFLFWLVLPSLSGLLAFFVWWGGTCCPSPPNSYKKISVLVLALHLRTIKQSQLLQPGKWIRQTIKELDFNKFKLFSLANRLVKQLKK